MLISNTSRRRALSSESQEPHTGIKVLRAEPGLFGKDDIVPLSVSIFVVQSTRVAISLCCTVKESRSNDPRADCPRCCYKRSSHRMSRYWPCCKHVHVHFLTNSSLCSCTILQGRPRNGLSVISGASHERALRSSMLFRMILSHLLILNSHDNDWILTSETGGITER